MLRAIYTQENQAACLRKAQEVAEYLRKAKLGGTAKTLEEGIAEMLTYTNHPAQHWLHIRADNGIERIDREIRRRTRAVGLLLPDSNSALMLVCTRLRHVLSSAWGEKAYLNIQHLYDLEKEHAN